MKTYDHPGVYIPPPLIYVAFYGLAWMVQTALPINSRIIHSAFFHNFGWLLLMLSFGITIPGLWKFRQTKNSLVPIKPAHSLQTDGIYAHTRNPMYLGLLLLYSGISCLTGNYWALFLLPFLILILQSYVIRREEKYLERAFDKDYVEYRNRVRRWI